MTVLFTATATETPCQSDCVSDLMDSLERKNGNHCVNHFDMESMLKCESLAELGLVNTRRIDLPCYLFDVTLSAREVAWACAMFCWIEGDE